MERPYPLPSGESRSSVLSVEREQYIRVALLMQDLALGLEDSQKREARHDLTYALQQVDEDSFLRHSRETMDEMTKLYHSMRVPSCHAMAMRTSEESVPSSPPETTTIHSNKRRRVGTETESRSVGEVTESVPSIEEVTESIASV